MQGVLIGHNDQSPDKQQKMNILLDRLSHLNNTIDK